MFLKSAGLLCLLFLTQCGKVVGSGDHSTIDGANLIIDAPLNINLSNINAYPVSGRCVVEAGDVVVSVGSPVVATQNFTCVNERFTGTIDLSSFAIPPGVIELSAAQTLLPISSTVRNANVDLSGAPPAPTINTPSAGAEVNSVSQTLTGVCIASGSLSFTGDIVGVPITATCTGGGTFSRTLTLTAANTNKTISVTQTTVSGTSPATNLTVSLDTVNPSAPTISTPASGSIVNTSAQTVSGNCETGASVRITGAIVGAPVITACSGATYSQAVTLTAAQGSKTITANQIDAAGNASTNTSSVISLDSIAPTAVIFTAPVNGSAVSSTSQTLLGNCEAGATIEFTGDIVGQPLSVICSGGGTFNRNITLVTGDDIKSIVANQTDAAGNTSVDTTLELTLDTLSPTVPSILTPVNASIVSSTAQTVTGDCEPGATVRVSGSLTASPVTTVCSGGGAFTRAVVLTAAQGSKTITVEQIDLAGNLSPNASVTVTLDTVAPSTPTISTPVSGSTVNNNSQTISGSCETAASVHISGSFAGSPLTVICSTGGYTQAITLTATQGTKTFTVNQEDAAGNTSSNASSSITYDTLAPAAPTFTNPANGSTLTSTTQTLTGSCEAGASVEITGDIISSPVTVVCSGGGTFSTIATLTAAQGSKSLDAVQEDAAGNISSNANTTFLLDSLAPNAPTIVSPLDGSYVNTASQTVSGACETGATVQITGAIVGAPITEVCIGGTYSQVVSLTPAQGLKAINVNQEDPAGNTSTTTTATVTFDSLTPAAPTITNPVNGITVGDVAKIIAGGCEIGATVQISGDIVGAPVSVSCGGGATYSQSITLTPAQGSKTLTVTQEDNAGNTSTSANVTVILDTIAPILPTIVNPADGSVVSTTSITVSGTCETSAIIQITGDIVSGPLTTTCSAGAYSRSVTLTATEGSKTVYVLQTDAGGNPSPSAISNFTLDSAAPAAPTIVTPSGGSYVAVTSQTVTGACEVGSTVEISGDVVGSPITLACGGGANYSQAVTLTASQGSKTITVNQEDSGGNSSPNTTVTITLDSIAPSAPSILNPVNGSMVNTATQVVSGACEVGADVEISGDVVGAPINTICSGGATYSQAITLSAGQGLKTIDVTQEDAAGNASSNSSSTVTLDSLAPLAPTITAPVSGIMVNTVSHTVSGACETGATVQISGAIIGSPISEICIGNSYSTVITLTAAQGSKSIDVNQTDSAGNVSLSSNSTITLDNVAPSAPTIATPANGSVVNTNAQTLTGNCEVSATVQISGDVIGAPISVVCSGGGTYSQAITLSAAQGSKTITVLQVDEATNSSTNTNSVITFDSIAPTAPTIVTPANGSTLNLAAQTVTGNCEASAEIQISGDVVSAPITLTCSGGTYSQAVTLTGTDGSKTITVQQEDAAGNLSPSTNSIVTLDSDVPLAPSITSPINGSFVNDVSQTITGSCETSATVHISGAFTGSPLTTSCTASAYTQAITLTAAQGVKSIDVYQEDVGGNISPTTNSTITLDSVAPSAPTITTPANGSLLNSAAQNVSGSCETGATVTIAGDILGSPLTQVCVASSYSQAVTLSAGQGSKSIDVHQTDVAGNISSASNSTVTLDSLAPTAPTIVTPMDGEVVNLTAVSIEGACETGATVEVNGDLVGVPLTTICVGSSYSIVANYSASQGSKTITVNQVDPAGNISTDVNSTITLDSVAPVVPTITTPVNSSYVNVTAQTVSGTCEAGATVEISGNIISSPVSTSCSGGNYSQVVTLTAAQGAKSIAVNQTDAANNTSTSTNISLTYDSIAPSAPSIVTPVDASLVNSTSHTVSGSCETGTTVEISGDILSSPHTTTCSSGSYSQAVTLTAAQGSKAIAVNQTDAASNTSTSTNISLTYDSIAPSAPSIVTPVDASLVNSTSQTVSGSCETGATVSISGAITGSPVTTTCVSNVYSQVVTLTATQGSKTINVEQTDASENTSSSASISITLDDQPPSAPTIVTPLNAGLVNTTSLTVTGVCETGATVEISGDIVGSPVTTVCSGSAYSEAVTLTASQGSKSIDVEQTDLANNTSSSTNSTFTLDSIAPSAPTIATPVDSSTVNSASQTLTGTCEANATLEISGNIVGSPVAAICDGGGAYSQAITLTAAQGLKAIEVVQTDAAGNESPSVGIGITLDTIAPSAPTITTPANGSFVRLTSQTVTGNCEANATVEITGDITPTPVTVTCSGGSTYSQAVTLTAAQGSKTITVQQEDIGGNASSTTNSTINFDSIAPIAPTITTPADSSLLNSASQTLTGTCEVNASLEITGDVVGAPVSATCLVGGNYSQAITLTATQGAKTISVTQTDAAMNVSPSGNSTVTLDTLAPSAPTIVTPSNGSYVNSATITFDGACETGATVSLTGDIVGGPITGACISNAYSIAVNLNAGQNLKNLTAVQTDAAGNMSADANSTVILDTTAPSAPTIVTPATGSYVNTANQTLTGVCEVGATLSISGDVDGSPLTTTCNGGGTYSLGIILNVAENINSVDVNQTDAAGNISVSANTSVTLDTLAPSAPTITSPVGGAFVNTLTQTVTGACESGATISITGDVVSAPATVVCLVGGTYSRVVTLTAAQGSKTIIAEQADLSGNISTSVDVTITLDSITPDAPTVVTPANGSLVNSTSQTITGACESGATVSISGDISGSPVSVVCAISNSYSQAITLTASQGTKSIDVEQVDAAANTSASTNTTITLDAIAPSAPTIVAPADGTLVVTTSQTVSGACETGATVEISGDILAAPLTLICASSSYSQAVTLTAAQGLKTITVSQEDPSGNASSATNSSVTLDSIAPTAPTIVTPANGSFINTTGRTVSGACESGASVEISGDIDGGPITETCIGATYSSAVYVTSVDGSKTINVVQTDPAGNASPNTSTTFTLDTLAPNTPTIATPANGSTVNTSSQTYTGNCETGATVEISGDVVSSPVTTTCSGGTYSRAVTLLGVDDVKYLSVNQTDAAGNSSGYQYSTITLDTLAPAAPTIATPANGSVVNNSAQTVTGSCEAGATVRFTGDIVGAPVTTICLVSNSYSRSVTLVSGEGSKTITAEQFDAGGNTSTNVSSVFTFDTSPPSAPTIVTPADASLVNVATQTVTGVCEDGATVRITGDILSAPVSDICVSSSYSIVVTLSAGQGAKTITVNQVDPAGNASSTVDSDITLDSIAPLAPTIATPADGSYVATTAQTVTGVCEAGATVHITGDVVGAPVMTTCLVSNSYSSSVTLTMSEGSKTITVHQVDAAANASTSADAFVTLDTIDPATPTITNPTHGSYVNTTSQTVTGACEAGTNVHINGNITGGTAVTVCLVSNTYSIAVTLTSSQGSKTITVEQEDLAGNVSSSVSSTFTLDTVAPSAPTLTTPENGSLQGTVSQTVTGSCETGAIVEISGDVVSSPVGTTCSSSSYSQVVTLTAAQGSKTVTVSQTDQAENTSSGVSSVFTLDTVAPAAPTIVTPANASRVNTTAQTVTGACETGATINITGNINSSPLTTTCSGGTYSRAVTLTSGEGSKTITVNQVDPAGNPSSVTNSTITLDLTAPTVVISSSLRRATSINPITLTVTFSEAVTGFVSGDLVVTNGSVTNFTGGPSVYNIEITPSADGSISIDIPAGRAQDLAGNNNTASNKMEFVYLAALAQNMFITRWVIPANNTAVTLPLFDLTPNYNFTVNWGDGSAVGTVTSWDDVDKNHTYTTAGEYVVIIQGTANNWGYSAWGAGHPCYIREVVQLGRLGWHRFTNAFRGCSNLVSFYTGNISNQFQNTFNANNMFMDAINLEVINTTNWDMSYMINLNGMFRNAAKVNPDVSLWDTSKVADMRSVFLGATVATPNVTNWNTGLATRMDGLFQGATLATPNVASWDTSQVTNFNNMFSGATNANPNMTSWSFAAATSASNILDGSGINNANYSTFLIRANATGPNGIAVGTIPARYQPSAAAARTNLLGPKGWTFTDNGAE